MTQLLGAFNIHLRNMSSSKRKDPFPLRLRGKNKKMFQTRSSIKSDCHHGNSPQNKFLEASLKSDYCNSSRCVNYMIKLQQVKQVGKLCRVILYVQNCLKAASKIFGVCIEKGNSHLELKFLNAPRSLKALVSSILWMREHHKESSTTQLTHEKKEKKHYFHYSGCLVGVLLMAYNWVV